MSTNNFLKKYENFSKQIGLAIVIINYRTPNLVIDCLRLLQKQIDINEHCVILVDSTSKCDSVLMLKQRILDNQYNSWVTLIESPVNEGFLAGNNVSIKAVTANEC
ncbi:MAG: glycosyltransferase family 2 protein [cyanobacterium endosymbiont of Rhopalodia musculus]|uniref:glycosyltransferase family 2 protein n=1 Tax=cyanobacterium endosymbiont of Epithemia clementina EcSB TaxID=3034674 RepID=UPI0024814FA9|nr:hypothetical protein [cyanobacterium endosymbiont of Epithemia clementina EcSB]WGT68256.1 hypothetical protein P3F56_04130 [cyanobacterium endosymbiont of Epithemia clementina EcSB]